MTPSLLGSRLCFALGLVAALGGCGGPGPTPDPAPAPAPAPVAPAPPPVVAVAQPAPVGLPQPPDVPAREPVHAAVDLAPGAAAPEGCAGACGALAVRVQASTERADGATRQVADLAVDGDPGTAWCAVDGVGAQLALAFPGPVDLRGLAVRMADGQPRWAAARLVSDRRDRIGLTLPDRPEAGAPLDLPGVQFVQLEVEGLRGEGPACLAEIALFGSLAGP